MVEEGILLCKERKAEKLKSSCLSSQKVKIKLLQVVNFETRLRSILNFKFNMYIYIYEIQSL